jgi:NAD(P) transhydrogenase
MDAERFDLVVIGSGPAGEKGAAQAAYFGRRVALVEKQPRLGGAGVNTGTVPSKTLRETALYFSGLRQRGLYGIDYNIRKDISVPDFMHRKDEVVHSLWSLITANIERHRIEVVHGAARLDDERTVRVSVSDGPDRLLRADVLLIATGSYPAWPDGVAHDPRLYDSDSILEMDRIPASLAVVGAGVIGCEYATIFRAMGVDVTLLSGHERLLPFLDHEIGDRLLMQMGLLGLHVLLKESVVETRLEAPRVELRLSSGRALAVESVLFATGRLGATAGLGLERIGVTPGRRGHLTVNEHYQTALPHVYAAGDVIGFPALASTSMEQARVAMCHAFDLKYKERVSSLLPMAVYTIPEIAGVGETEESCRQKQIACCVGRALYRGNSRGQIIGDLSGLVKILFSPEDRKLLGVHILGEMASELVHIGQGCLHFGGTLDYFIQAVFNYPTLAEAYKYAAYDGLGNLAARRAGDTPGASPGGNPGVN